MVWWGLGESLDNATFRCRQPPVVDEAFAVIPTRGESIASNGPIVARKPARRQTDLPVNRPRKSVNAFQKTLYGNRLPQALPPGSLPAACRFTAIAGWPHEWTFPSAHPHDMPVRMLRVLCSHPCGYAAASSNCASSVDPSRAVTEVCPAEIVVINLSKNPVPTNFWCFTAR